MDLQRQLLSLVDLVYESAVDADIWPLFLDRLADSIHAEGVVLFASADPQPLAVMTRFDPELIDLYAREFADNIWVRRADRIFSIDEIRFSQALTTTAELKRDRYYADFLSPANVAFSAGMKVCYESPAPAYLAASRSARSQPFEQQEGELLLALRPHIARSLQLRRRLAHTAAITGLLHSLPIGAVFLERAGAPIWHNDYAQTLFTTRDGIWIGPSGLRCFRAPDEAQLKKLIETASKAVIKRDAGGFMCLRRRSLKQAYAVAVSPVLTRDTRSDAAAVVLITDPHEHHSSGTAPRLAAQFGLTAAESDVAEELLQGRTAGEAAVQLGISTSTIRTHIRNLLRKTGAERQTDLLRTLLTSPYLLEPPTRWNPVSGANSSDPQH